MQEEEPLSNEEKVSIQNMINEEVENELRIQSVTGACYITVYGMGTSCHGGLTRRSCYQVANNVGGTARFVPNGRCR